MSESLLKNLRRLFCFWHDSRGETRPFDSNYPPPFGNFESTARHLSIYSPLETATPSPFTGFREYPFIDHAVKPMSRL